MIEYRRYFIPGGTYFFTVNLAERSCRLLVEHIALLRAAFAATRREHPFKFDAVTIWSNMAIAVRWRLGRIRRFIVMLPWVFTPKIGRGLSAGMGLMAMGNDGFRRALPILRHSPFGITAPKNPQ